MEWLQNWLDSTSIPIVAAFILGIMTAISPCPLATNITAIAFISRDISSRKRVFVNGLIYTLGRAFSYTALGVILYFGASVFRIASFFHGYSERLLGPVLLIIGLFMTGLIRIKIPGFRRINDQIEKKDYSRSYWRVFLLGALFALAFCPYSGALYFLMLIPMSVQSVEGLTYPFVFAIATGLPVIIVAWLIAFTISGIGGFYNRLKQFEFWFRRIVAVVFMGAGLYFIYLFYIAPYV